MSIIKTVLKKNASQEVMNFIQVLVENNRILVLDEIYQIFRELILEDQQIAIGNNKDFHKNIN